MQLKETDYIIVGQGLAGSCIAMQLLRLGKKIVVIDKPDENSASAVAAGLFNPITGREMKKTWMADELYPYLHQFYKKIESLTVSKFFFPMPLFRPFVSVEEQNEWMGASTDPKFSSYIEKIYTRPYSDQVKNPLGGLLLKHCGYLNTNDFLKSVRNYIQQHARLVEEEFRYDELKIGDQMIQYGNWTSPKIIFCCGVKVGPHFSWLPIRPLKGETLSIKTEEMISVIYNRGVFLVPEILKVGATYNYKDTGQGITTGARKELEQMLSELIGFSYTIMGQSWGFRPTTPDRKPILGVHPEFEPLIIFNGLGTKGVSLAPYFSNVLADWLENGRPLNKEVDISRYKSLNWKSA